MAWIIELSDGAQKQLRKLDRVASERILRFLKDRLAKAGDPRQLGSALKGETLGHFWRYRIGDYRVVAHLDDGRVTVLIVTIGHRRDIYRG